MVTPREAYRATNGVGECDPGSGPPAVAQSCFQVTVKRVPSGVSTLGMAFFTVPLTILISFTVLPNALIGPSVTALSVASLVPGSEL
jgi:hypothetical protein